MMNRGKRFFLFSVMVSSSATFAATGKNNHDTHKRGDSAGYSQSNQKGFDAGMKPVLHEYLNIHEELMKNAPRVTKINNFAKKISLLTRQLDPESVKGEHSKHYGSLPVKLTVNADALSLARDIVQARRTFVKLSQPMAMWAGMAKPEGFSVMYCPMAKASWVQKKGETENPYNSKMQRCGGEV